VGAAVMVRERGWDDAGRPRGMGAAGLRPGAKVQSFVVITVEDLA
jgi:hypothetical protein